MVEPFGDGDFALVGGFLADDHAKERGLAGAVGTHQADLLAGVQLKGSVDEDQLLAVLLIDIGERKSSGDITKLAEAAGGARLGCVNVFGKIRYGLTLPHGVPSGLGSVSNCKHAEPVAEPGPEGTP